MLESAAPETWKEPRLKAVNRELQQWVKKIRQPGGTRGITQDEDESDEEDDDERNLAVGPFHQFMGNISKLSKAIKRNAEPVSPQIQTPKLPTPVIKQSQAKRFLPKTPKKSPFSGYKTFKKPPLSGYKAPKKTPLSGYKTPKKAKPPSPTSSVFDTADEEVPVTTPLELSSQQLAAALPYSGPVGEIPWISQSERAGERINSIKRALRKLTSEERKTKGLQQSAQKPKQSESLLTRAQRRAQRRALKKLESVTYPRPCPTCGKEFKLSSSLSRHKTQCGTTEHRYHCPHCPMSFADRHNKRYDIQRQHSSNPQGFTCPKCHHVLASKQNLNVHLETVCAEVKSCYPCWFCSAGLTRESNRQRHMRRVHGRVCRAQDINLLLHLQHLSEERDCNNEWIFVESRPIEAGEHHICPCRQNNIQHYFFLENKLNGNRTFVGSTCIEHLDERVGKVIAYFHHTLCRPIQGTYVGDDSTGLQTFTVNSNTVLVRGAETNVNHLNPPVTCIEGGKHQVLVKYRRPETLVQEQSYDLRLKAKYVQGQLTFTAV